MLYDFFDDWSHESAYFLGLLWADGSLSKTRVKFGLKLQDESHVRLIAEKIQYDGSFTISEPCVKKDGVQSSGFIEFNIVNQKLSRALRKKGLKENKTYLDLPFPKVPDSFLWSFVRGYFDGDGSVFQTSQGYYRISIVGTPVFLEQMKSRVSKSTDLLSNGKIRKHQSSFVYYLEWSKKEEVLSFLLKLYNMEKDLALPRKKDMSFRFIKSLKQDLLNKGIGKKNGRWRLRAPGGKHVSYFDDLEEARSARDTLYGWKDLTE